MNIFITKQIVGIVAGLSVSVVVDNVIRATMPVGAGIAQKALCTVGSTVIGGMVGYHASNYMAAVIDDAVMLKNVIMGNHKENITETEEA